MSDQNKSHLESDDDAAGWGTGWAYWLIWVIATVVAWSLNNLVRSAIFEASGSNMSQVVTGVAIGICLGLAQWFVLIQQPYKTGLWWVLVTVAGWGFGWALGWQIGWGFFGSFGFGVVFGLIGLVAGTLVGAGQWYIFRDQVQGAAWWILANAIGWGLGLAITYTVARSYGWFVTSGIAGAITGAALIWLLRHPMPDGKIPGEL